jgi:leucyl/phenylalanyl-tRNA--protein transferase
MHDISLEDILNAYCNGIFPMAEILDNGEEDIGWYDPPIRGILPLEKFNVPRSLKKLIRQKQDDFIITVNTDFEAVMKACADTYKGREETWISPTIIDWYCGLNSIGFAHSIEYRNKADLTLLGGLYGISIGKAFFGESMFSKESGASKIALVALATHLTENNFELLDTQFVNNHLLQFGCIEIEKDDYLTRLHKAISQRANFTDNLKKNDNAAAQIDTAKILSFIQS